MDYWEKQKRLKEEEEKRQSIISEMSRNTRQKAKIEREDFFFKNIQWFPISYWNNYSHFFRYSNLVFIKICP